MSGTGRAAVVRPDRHHTKGTSMATKKTTAIAKVTTHPIADAVRAERRAQILLKFMRLIDDINDLEDFIREVGVYDYDTLGREVVFRGFGANVPLRGQLALRSRGYSPMSAHGQIVVQRMVQVDAFGQSLMLRRAEVNFNGSLTAPTLAIEATKSVEGRTVGVRIGGQPTAPGIVIFNDAGLTEQEALNALLTGRLSANNTLTNTAGFRSDVNNTLAAAGLSYGLGGVRTFTNELGRSFGLSGLTVDAQGVGNDTQVNLTGYITPDLYLRYGMGVFTPVNKLTLRYQINRRLYVEASSALEKAIELCYNWRF